MSTKQGLTDIVKRMNAESIKAFLRRLEFGNKVINTFDNVQF